MADSAELIRHVQDSGVFDLPRGLEVHLLPERLEKMGLHLTKFMVLEVVVAVMMVAIFVPLARRMASGGRPRGRWWNMFEVMVLFIRDQVARPAIGRHDADRFLPFLWTMFFFILFLNLIGLVPWGGAPTGALGVTGALALITFVTVVGAGIAKLGPAGFWTGQVPHMDVPLAVGIFVRPMIFCLEVFGLCVRHAILAVRLFANMFAGHLVLAVVVGFIAAAAPTLAWYGVMPSSVLGAVALDLLEVLVALIQAYVFTFLAALFIGMAVHQH
ncbi:MAG: F0F1 ATP synthase subunit A [Thermoguttaceae bacterium]